MQDYYRRINDHEKFYQTVEETEWPFIKIINVSYADYARVEMIRNRCRSGKR